VNAQKSIVLIDDKPEMTTSLGAVLRPQLEGVGVRLETWNPDKRDDDIREKFDSLVGEGTALVVTDYDLTRAGVMGLYGTTIVGWCQQARIPVGDFSRGYKAALPSEPNLFEIRIPTDDDTAAARIVSLVNGFRDLETAIAGGARESARSPAGVLANVVGRPQMESRFGPYTSRLGTANPSLVAALRSHLTDTADPPAEETPPADPDRLLTYVLGHVMLNGIMRYPGPLVHLDGVAAYFGTTRKTVEALAPDLVDCLYGGPFADGGPYYWRDLVDSKIDEWAADLPDVNMAFDEYNRAAAREHLGLEPEAHGCDRCDGFRGGFWCPFTLRPVCVRPDCSAPSSSWIPAGADLTRVEMDFYEEWAPMMGF